MERPIITISDGQIQGTTVTSVLGKNYLAFKGIPFAEPPIGPLRFKAPQLPSKWTGIRDASEYAGKIAMQYRTDGPKPFDIIGGEDCLYLNVFTNKIDHKRPVMVYIHGGGFIEGTGNDYLYREDYLMTADIVLVSINYRLGPMGFLNLNHEVAPGNQGLRDIILSLKWVQDNIEAFGGDSNNVTIFGNSAGSMLCHLFTLLPCTKGLFHKAILQSGTTFNRNILYEEDTFANGFRIASLLGFESDNPVKILEFLQTLPGEKLIELQDHVCTNEEKKKFGQLEYGPNIDVNYTKDPIIPVPISKLIKNDAHVPIIVGYTLDESLLFFMSKFDDEENFKFYNDNIEEIVKNHLLLTDSSKFPEIMNNIREYYLKNKPINKDNVWNLIYLMSDLFVINKTRKLVDLRNEHATTPTYVYCFSYLGNEPTIYQFDEGPQPLKGVAHADELSYLFYLTYIKKHPEHSQIFKEGSTDRLIMERLVKMWYNFAATGNPTPTTDDHCITTIWKASSKTALHYLDINKKLTIHDDKNSKGRVIYDKMKDIYLF